MKPSRLPMSAATNDETKATSSETRAPNATRARRSRPSVSVPNQ